MPVLKANDTEPGKTVKKNKKTANRASSPVKSSATQDGDQSSSARAGSVRNRPQPWRQSQHDLVEDKGT